VCDVLQEPRIFSPSRSQANKIKTKTAIIAMLARLRAARERDVEAAQRVSGDRKFLFNFLFVMTVIFIGSYYPPAAGGLIVGRIGLWLFDGI
jgi:hypothetical protein